MTHKPAPDPSTRDTAAERIETLQLLRSHAVWSRDNADKLSNLAAAERARLRETQAKYVDALAAGIAALRAALDAQPPIMSEAAFEVAVAAASQAEYEARPESFDPTARGRQVAAAMIRAALAALDAQPVNDAAIQREAEARYGRMVQTAGAKLAFINGAKWLRAALSSQKGDDR